MTELAIDIASSETSIMLEVAELNFPDEATELVLSDNESFEKAWESIASYG